MLYVFVCIIFNDKIGFWIINVENKLMFYSCKKEDSINKEF